MHRFFNAAHVHGNVVFNFTRRPIDDLGAFALGYREAANILAQRMAAARGYADYDGYPILFMYRHALELSLKAIVYRGAKLVGLISEEHIDVKQLFERHDLTRLLPAIKSIFDQLGSDFEGSGLESYDDFADLIRSIDSIDSGSYTFRYPIDRTGEANLPHHFVVNVLEFAQGMDTLLQFLDGAKTAIDEQWQAEQEAHHELEQLAADWEGGDA